MNKNTKIIIGVIVVIVVVVGSIAIFHKSPKPTTTTSSSTTQSSTVTVNNAILVTKTSSSQGAYLAKPDGTPLYTYNGDTSGVSNVTGSLLVSWPAYQDTGSTTGLPSGVSTIKRTDNGQIQFTFNGLPLYTFVADSSGNPTGNGVSNFTLAKPAAATTSHAPDTTAPSTTSTQPSNSSSSNNPY